MDLLESARKKSGEVSFLGFANIDASDDDSDRVPSLRTSVDVGEPVDALSANREQNRFVAAGLRVLKIFEVENDALKNVCELRFRRKSLPPSNVAWSKLRDDLIATTSTTGMVGIWDACAGQLDFTYKCHERAATVVHFHRENENLLISGSRDETVLLYDLRDPHSYSTKFLEFSFLRDLSFCIHPGQYDMFVTANDNGNIRLWDIRRPDGPIVEFPAHTGYISSIALNPNEKNLIASGGGRDRFLKLWDLSSGSVKAPMYQVETMAPVGRVCWRPDEPFQVVTCAVVNDMSVHVWDVRRPVLPVASFDEHTDSVTDVWWSKDHPHYFVSCSKDKKLVLHRVADATVPLNYACDAAFDLAPDGTVALGVNSMIQEKADNELVCMTIPQLMDNSITPKWRSSRRPKAYEPFRAPAHSVVGCGVPDTAVAALRPNQFYGMATSYRLAETLCMSTFEYNAQVAEHFGAPSVARLWRFALSILQQLNMFDDDINNEHPSSDSETSRAKLDTSFDDCDDNYVVNMRKGKRKRVLYPNEQIHWQPMSRNVSELVDFSGLRQEAFDIRPTGFSNDNLEDVDPLSYLGRLLVQLSYSGDVQSCCMIATACGEVISKVIDVPSMIVWTDSYLAMLERLELFSMAAMVRRFTWVDAISAATLESTHMRILHSTCKHQVTAGHCKSCQSDCISVCVICSKAIEGAVWSCPHCMHPCHPHHAMDWFRRNPIRLGKVTGAKEAKHRPRMSKTLRPECASAGCHCLCWKFAGNDFHGTEEEKHERFTKHEDKLDEEFAADMTDKGKKRRFYKDHRNFALRVSKRMTATPCMTEHPAATDVVLSKPSLIVHDSEIVAEQKLMRQVNKEMARQQLAYAAVESSRGVKGQRLDLGKLPSDADFVDKKYFDDDDTEDIGNWNDDTLADEDLPTWKPSEELLDEYSDDDVSTSDPMTAFVSFAAPKNLSDIEGSMQDLKVQKTSSFSKVVEPRTISSKTTVNVAFTRSQWDVVRGRSRKLLREFEKKWNPPKVEKPTAVNSNGQKLVGVDDCREMMKRAHLSSNTTVSSEDAPDDVAAAIERTNGVDTDTGSDVVTVVDRYGGRRSDDDAEISDDDGINFEKNGDSDGAESKNAMSSQNETTAIAGGSSESDGDDIEVEVRGRRDTTSEDTPAQQTFMLPTVVVSQFGNELDGCDTADSSDVDVEEAGTCSWDSDRDSIEQGKEAYEAFISDDCTY